MVWAHFPLRVNSLSLLAIFPVVPFKNIQLFSKDLIAFVLSLISLSVRVFPELVDSFIGIFLVLITACIILSIAK